MTVASCPHCGEGVTIPAGLKANARVACPLCQEELVGDDFLHQLPPSLVLLDPVEVAVEESTQEAESGQAEEVDFDPDNPFGEIREGDGGAAVITRVRRSSSSRSKSSSGGGMRQIISIVLGGLLALPIAQLILWQLNRDPVGLVEKWSLRDVGWLQWALPRDKNAPPAQSPEESDSSQGPSVSQLQAPTKDQFYGGGVNQFPGPELDKMPREFPENRIPDPPEPETNPDDNRPLATTDGDPGNLTSEWIDGAPTYKGLILSAMLRHMRESLAELEAAGEDLPANERARLEDGFCAMLAQLAHAVTFADGEDPEAEEQVQQVAELLTSLQIKPAILKLITDYGRLQYSTPESGLRGIVLVGQIDRIQENGDLFETIVQVPGQELVVEAIVVSRQDPAPALQAGQRILVLGSATLEPREVIQGYESDAEQVVIGGYPLVLPGRAVPEE